MRARRRFPLSRLFAWALVAALGLLLAYQATLLARVWWLRDHDPASTAFMRARQDALAGAGMPTTLDHRWVPYPRISGHLKRAVIAAEDAKFLSHRGFDWEGIEHALDKNLRQGRVVAGGSTLTQQLAKNLFLSGSRTPWRKLQEAAVTVMLEKLLSKRRILELYLNVAEWGGRVFGAEAAARHYFRTGAAGLSAGQAARLAAMLPRPRHYQAHPDSRRLARHSATVRARMRLVEAP